MLCFGAAFNHVVEFRYSERDTITILQASLEEKPLELIKEIGCDYTAAWETQNLQQTQSCKTYRRSRHS